MATNTDKNYRVFNTIPPSKWAECIPVGNGRMGAGIMGKVACEEIFLNEESVWGSKPFKGINPEMPQKLEQIRNLFLEGEIIEANKLGETILKDCCTRICSYEYAGKMKVALHDADCARNYHWEIDLLNGIASVEYDIRESHYKREAFASYPDDVIVYRITSSNEPITAYISYERENLDYVVSEDNEIVSKGHTVCGNHNFCVKIRVETDGKTLCKDGIIKVTDTNCAVILVKIETEFKKGINYEKAEFAETDFDILKKRHTEDFSEIMNRADIDIQGDCDSEVLSVAERRQRLLWNQVADEGFYTLQWQMGRYILASSSRPGSLPANLQGIWTNCLNSPWSGDYHTNINLQENYWGAEVANLSDCHIPLFDYMNNYLLESAKETAKTGYGARGCAVHHLSDIYGFTAPADGLHGIWPQGASWLSYHMWDHYTFTNDMDFLRNEAYEFIRQSALFFLDTMVKDKNGYLVFGPSHSPENKYLIEDENGEKHQCYLTLSPAIDIEIISGLFEIYTKASKVLGIEDDDVRGAQNALKIMPPLVIGKYGQICDWMEDFEEVEVGHHHLSPTFGLYPGYTINRSTPDLLKAVEVTLHRRLTGKTANGDPSAATTAAMGLMWVACLYARLFRGNDAYAAIKRFALQLTLNNMWYNECRAFWDTFQCDGNLAYVGAVCEMLIQSHEGVISLIPSIPDKWGKGSFRGLRARGDFQIDAKWENHSICEITISSQTNDFCIIELPKSQKAFEFTDGTTTYKAIENKLEVKLRNGMSEVKTIHR